MLALLRQRVVLMKQAESSPEKKRANRRSYKRSDNKEQKPRGEEKNQVGVVVIAVLVGAATLIATLKGLWHEPWLKFVILPLTLIAIGWWLYEVIGYKLNRLWAVTSALVWCVVSGSLTLLLYSNHPPPIEETRESIIKVDVLLPPILPDGTTNVILTLGGSSIVRAINLDDPKHANPKIIDTNFGLAFYIKNSRLFVDAAFPCIPLKNSFGTRDTRIIPNPTIVSIKQFTLGSLPLMWDANQNSNAIEVVDQRRKPVFQMLYKAPNHVIINGFFLLDKESMLVATDFRGMELPIDERERQDEFIPIFKYPSQLHLGEYAR